MKSTRFASHLRCAAGSGVNESLRFTAWLITGCQDDFVMDVLRPQYLKAKPQQDLMGREGVRSHSRSDASSPHVSAVMQPILSMSRVHCG